MNSKGKNKEEKPITETYEPYRSITIYDPTMDSDFINTKKKTKKQK